MPNNFSFISKDMNNSSKNYCKFMNEDNKTTNFTKRICKN